MKKHSLKINTYFYVRYHYLTEEINSLSYGASVDEPEGLTYTGFEV